MFAHTLLREYGVVSGDTSKVRRSLTIKPSSLELGKDYIEVKEEYEQYRVSQPDAFKKCLMRARNTDRYANYYLHLEKCIQYYNELWS
jgi:hypothetical protein